MEACETLNTDQFVPIFPLVSEWLHACFPLHSISRAPQCLRILHAYSIIMSALMLHIYDSSSAHSGHLYYIQCVAFPTGLYLYYYASVL